MRKQFHSGNILNKKFHPGMVRDLKTDCAKCTEEVRSGFCNIGSGVSLKKTEMTSKSKELFFGVFFYVQAGGRRKKTRRAFDRIDYKTSRKAGNKMKTKKQRN